MRKEFKGMFAVALVFCLAAAFPALAQRPQRGLGLRAQAQAPRQADHLTRLKRALQVAGAAALSSDQETQINSLITSFRASHTPPTPNPSVQSARAAFDNAILSGNYDTASANIIAQNMATQTATRLQEGANFAISVVRALSKDQVSQLVTRFGNVRAVQLLESLAGGPGPGMRRAAVGMGRPAIQ